jgi:DNA helicase IV
VADVALLDELRVLLGEPPKAAGPKPDPSGVRELTTWADRETPARDLDRPDHYDEYAHVVVDEAQDLSPMQWRMLGRRGRLASWTIVGDPAQSAWPDPAEADRARDAALRGKRRHDFTLTTNYRNSAEIFELAGRVIHKAEPELDLPVAVRSTGEPPDVRVVSRDDLQAEITTAVTEMLDQVDGTIGVVAPEPVTLPESDRVHLLTPLDTKGLEFDGVVVVGPERIAAGVGGAHTLYVVLTRATQRLTVLTTDPGWPS